MAKDKKVRKDKSAASAGRDVPPTAENGTPEGPVVAGGEEALREDISALNTRWMRALADLDNYKKRVERERARWAAEAREEILLSLLEVTDDFERAVASGDDSGLAPDDPFRAGVELILDRLREVLWKNGVTPIDICEAGFDPMVHEAVAHVESDDHESDQIVEEVRRGYMLGDRLLRCSRVIVAK